MRTTTMILIGTGLLVTSAPYAQAQDTTTAAAQTQAAAHPSVTPDLGVIVKPARRRIDFAFHGNLHLEAVPVQPPAFMCLRQERQQVRRLKLKRFS